MGAMRRVLPYPILTLSLTIMWLLLNGLSLGHLLLGTTIALIASRMMLALQPSKPRIRRYDLIPKLFFIVLGDIVRSNIAVVSIILHGRRREVRAGFLMIDLELRDPTGLAVLACITTSTPGTAWVEYRTGTGQLLLHILDLVDESVWIDLFKNRYERLLLEIFE